MSVLKDWPKPEFDLVYADFPWPMYGDPNKDAAAGKHYDLMTMEEIKAVPMKSLLRNRKSGVFFIWVTSPRFDLGIDAIRAWGLHFRGVAFVWVKTRKDGGIIHGQGVRPTVTKPTTEFCLAATTCKRGRPFPLFSEKTPQVVLAPRGRHSEKPQVFRDLICELYGDEIPKVELFARTAAPGFTPWGNQAPEAK